MNKKFVFFMIISLISTFLIAQTTIFINEIHYDNVGGDVGEAIEIAGPAGTDLTGWSVVLYNGADSQTYGTIPLSGTIPNLCNGGVLAFSYAGIQNGSPDGMALINPTSTVIQFLSYEGVITATNGPAAGMTSIDIGVSEEPAPPIGQSLQLTGIGTNYEDFIWTGPTIATFGACNVEQSLPVELSYFTASLETDGVLLQWATESEIENLGFILERKTIETDWHEIVSYKQDESLLGQGTVSFPSDYEHLDNLVIQGNNYEYRLADVDYNGVVTYHATRSVFIPDKFSVIAYPNPFNPSTIIKYNLSYNALAHIAIYDITGKLINTLINQEQSVGWHEVQWNGTNQNGKEVPGGIYLSRVTVGNEVKTNKLILLR